MTKVINAEGRVIGRLASEVAQIAMDGEEVHIVNSEHAVISGDEAEIKDEYKTKYDRGRKDFGPYYPKRPDKILKRTVRGMLPDEKKRGREMHSRVKTYLGVPEEFDPEEVDVKEGDELKNRNYVKLGEVSKHIGWTPRGEE